VIRDGHDGLLASLGRNTVQHLKLTVTALIGAVIVGVGLSLLVFRMPVVSRAVTYFCGLLQTIPSIALLALLIPVLGIGMAPAVLALFLYSLLPILRNTLTALTTIDPTLIRVAVAMGLKPSEQLRYLFLPLSLPSMFAGIRTAAVISIGTATLAAFIGAGGLGDPIVTGLALNDTHLILQGAVPAAILAVLTELMFEGLERWLIPGSLKE
jgi:osmoprotectant transport system permease protein